MTLDVVKGEQDLSAPCRVSCTVSTSESELGRALESEPMAVGQRTGRWSTRESEPSPLSHRGPAPVPERPDQTVCMPWGDLRLGVETVRLLPPRTVGWKLVPEPDCPVL